ncbi:MAG: OmpP1/FadL family transporter [Panacagrimonas sp.]
MKCVCFRVAPDFGRRVGFTAAILVASTQAALAGHGLNVIGAGTESMGMAGADAAVSRDTAAVNLNPAGLTQLARRATDVTLEPFHTGRLGHSDSFGNDHNENDIPFGVIATASHALPLARWPGLVVGIGLFAQGGTGYAYDDMPNVFGTKDDFSSIFGVFKLASGFGYRVSEKLSVGANLGLSYASARQKFFPDTSVLGPSPEQNFYGLRFDGGESLAPNFKLGLQYRTTATLTLAAVYNSKITLDLDGASLTVNYEALGLGRVKYTDAELKGFALPQEFGVGLAWRATPRWLLAAEVNWLDWSNALKSTRVHASRPSAQNLSDELQSVELRQTLNWKDQYALAVGTAWNYDEKTVLRMGFDRVGNPSPRENSSPLLNIFAKNEITFGFSRVLDEHRIFGMALQYQLPETVRYTNTNLPFGENAREHFELIGLVFSLGWR